MSRLLHGKRLCLARKGRSAGGGTSFRVPLPHLLTSSFKFLFLHSRLSQKRTNGIFRLIYLLSFRFDIFSAPIPLAGALAGLLRGRPTGYARLRSPVRLTGCSVFFALNEPIELSAALFQNVCNAMIATGIVAVAPGNFHSRHQRLMFFRALKNRDHNYTAFPALVVALRYFLQGFATERQKPIAGFLIKPVDQFRILKIVEGQYIQFV